jgi:hypothetical protein
MKTQAGTPKSLTALTNEANQWWLFCLLVVLLKFFLLALDPLPKMFIGDSASYLATALLWICDSVRIPLDGKPDPPAAPAKFR